MTGAERERLLDRARHLVKRHLEPARFGTPVPLDLYCNPLGDEPVTYAEAVKGNFSHFSIGERWGSAWSTSWFLLRATVPSSWRGRRVDVRLDLGFASAADFSAEALLWRDGEPFAGVDYRHPNVKLLESAGGDEHVELYLEAACNPKAGDGRLLAPDYDGPPQLTFKKAELATRDTRVDAAITDFSVLVELAEQLPLEGRRTAEVLNALRRAAAVLDGGDPVTAAAAARSLLAGALSRPAGPNAHRVIAVGHAHIDTAWLWPLREAERKCSRTFSTTLRLLEDERRFVFVCSQAQQHAWMKEDYPAIFARMTELSSSGQFQPVGSMWVEPDCNIPSGESLVRQFLYGKRFFAANYGVETTECWLPDAFGYPAGLPQLMVQAGIHLFISQKLSWNETTRLPHHTFWWEGVDGSRVLAHFPPADTYNGEMAVSELVYSARNFSDHDVSDVSLYPFGHGDGGGGPTEEMLARARRFSDLEGVPRVSLAPLGEFVESVEAAAAGLDVWSGELYLEYHRGTYTSQAATKAGNRAGEDALYQAELWASLLGKGRAQDERQMLGDAWRSLLVHQFHDILPGSSINRVHSEAEAAHAEISMTALAALETVEAVLAREINTGSCLRPVIFINSSGHDRREVAPVAAAEPSNPSSPPLLVAPGGESQELQWSQDGWLALVDVPACGWATYDLRTREQGLGAPAKEAALSGPVMASPDRLENDLLRVDFEPDGLIRSIYDKQAGREVLQPRSQGNLLVLFSDDPANYDAWNVDEYYVDRSSIVAGAERVEVAETGPWRGALKVSREFGASRLEQLVRLEAHSKRLDFITDVDWHERHKLLKARFTVTARSSFATYGIQFGHIQRPTHSNMPADKARFEMCAQRFADLSEHGYGVALLSNDKYGYRVQDQTMEISLLRAPTAPDPEADQGRHHFTYSLLPHLGNPEEAQVIEAASALGQPVRAVVTATGQRGTRPPRFSLLSFDRPGLVLSAVKYAEDDDDVVVRFYEAHGGRGRVRLRLGLLIEKAWRADIMERPGRELAVEHTEGGAQLVLEVRPFEVVSLKLRLAIR